MRAGRKRIVGVDYDEGPPVPIPNTEVKLVRAENTWLVTAREDRCSPTQKALSQGSAFFVSKSPRDGYVKKRAVRPKAVTRRAFLSSFYGISLDLPPRMP